MFRLGQKVIRSKKENCGQCLTHILQSLDNGQYAVGQVGARHGWQGFQSAFLPQQRLPQMACRQCQFSRNNRIEQNLQSPPPVSSKRTKNLEQFFFRVLGKRKYVERKTPCALFLSPIEHSKRGARKSCKKNLLVRQLQGWPDESAAPAVL